MVHVEPKLMKHTVGVHVEPKLMKHTVGVHVEPKLMIHTVGGLCLSCCSHFGKQR